MLRTLPARRSGASEMKPAMREGCCLSRGDTAYLVLVFEFAETDGCVSSPLVEESVSELEWEGEVERDSIMISGSGVGGGEDGGGYGLGDRRSEGVAREMKSFSSEQGCWQEGHRPSEEAPWSHSAMCSRQ